MIGETRRLRALGMGFVILSMIACGLGQPTSTPAPAAPRETVAPDAPEPTVTPAASDTPEPTPTSSPTRTRVPTDTPEPTDTPRPTPTRTSRPTQKPSPTSSPTTVPTPTPRPLPTATPVPPAAPTQPPPPPPPPSSGVLSTFLSDARQTQADLLEVKIWFDRLAGSESVACSTVFAHSIHTPVSNAPAQDPELVGIWHEYEGALASGQLCLQWLVDFCAAGGGNIDYGTFWDRRALSSDALSRAEHVVQALEARR